MPLTSFFSSKKAPFLILSVFTLLVHAPLLINTGIYWDDWLWIDAISEGAWDTIYAIGAERGVPLDGYVHWGMSYYIAQLFGGEHIFHYGIGHKWITLVVLIGISNLVYQIAHRSGFLTKVESLIAALLTVSYPAFQTYVILCSVNNVFYYSMFLLATLLTLLSLEKQGRKHWIYRISALFVFFISFSMGAFFVFFFGFLGLLFLIHLKRNSGRLIDSTKKFFLKYPDFILFPFACYLFRKVVFATYGDYAQVYQVRFSLSDAFGQFGSFLKNGIYRQLGGVKTEFLDKPVLFLGLAAILFGVFFYQKHRIPTLSPKPKNTLLLFIFGGALFLLGILPYILIGEALTQYGWWTRHALLMGLPLSLIFLAAFQFSLKLNPKKPWINYTLLALLLAGFSAVTLQNYLHIQLRWVKGHSVIVNLSKVPEIGEKYSIFLVRDRFVIDRVQGSHASYEWTTMMKTAWQNEKHFANEAHYKGLDEFLRDFETSYPRGSEIRKRYNVSDLNPNGERAYMDVLPAEQGWNRLKIVAKYFYYWVFKRDEFEWFLTTVTKLKFGPVQK